MARLLDAECNEDLQDPQSDVTEILSDLKLLSEFPITVELLNETDAGEQISNLATEHPDRRVTDAAQATLKAWRAAMLATQLGTHLQTRANVVIPSSNCSGLKGVFSNSSIFQQL